MHRDRASPHHKMIALLCAAASPGLLVASSPFVQPRSQALPVLRSSRCGALRCQEQQPQPASSQSATLPAGWTSQLDPSTGLTYYIDTVNQVSQWEIPTVPAVPAAPAASAPPPPPPQSPVEPAMSIASQQQQQQQQQQQAVASGGSEGGGELFGGLVSADQNPYVASKASRMRAKFGDNVEGVLTPAQEAKRAELESSLAADLARFKAENAPARSAGDGERTLLQNVIDTLGKILTFNFFVIVIFFLWFLTGVGAKFGAQNEAIIDSFRGAWDVLIMPLLTTHMTLTFLSAGLERLPTGEEEKA